MTTLTEFRKVGDKLRNWGRWGEDNQLGTLNFIESAKLVESASLVRKGAIFPLGVDFNAELIWPQDNFRRNPVHVMTVDGADAATMAEFLPGYGGPTEKQLLDIWQTPFRFADDMIIMPLQCGTQWDALSHAWYEDLMYNGVPGSAVSSRGAARNSIDQVDVKGVVARGVLLDAARHKGVAHLTPNSALLPDDLDEIAAAQGVEIRSGDTGPAGGAAVTTWAAFSARTGRRYFAASRSVERDAASAVQLSVTPPSTTRVWPRT
ncbi:hypothetical protein F8568_005515 [Actinomadura sp. LD22]|uniref:Cyclase family protein n=1 Tax=Actinomadura physcomitrii TaxID=2650748 RepID=A0A6I4MCH2_9ACTN|nr:cyclase family protein [Actinomadura physcomitrii]MVZ99845.1 hypothetical protein [Actinomadura physcomitrii]